MEFKEPCSIYGLFVDAVLIESDWNLKLYSSDSCRYLRRVLIESDWNLKDDSLIFSDSADVVLIESDWNLKKIGLLEEQTTETTY